MADLAGAPGMVDRASWQRLSSCLDEALEVNDDQRALWLAELRAVEPQLATEVAALLAEHDAARSEGFLEGVAPMPSPAPGLSGRRLGAYTLQESIGQGGMGSVWRALRTDGQYQAAVAIKLLNTALIGAAGVARFQREGSILARLQHPNIAHLLDAGVSPDGQPYLVLELVEGEPIDAHCKRLRLGVEARIRLFIDVLAAVEHAHTHLVVHRDLKPSNVLVMADGRAKLLDFGIAKLLEVDTADGPALTQENTRVMTPQYAAPEQLQGGPITTATDVYALGVMLYQLLGGRHPSGDHHTSPAQWMLATLGTDPAPLSGLAATHPRLSAAELERIATERGSSVAGLQRRLKGDLDNIVARALEKPAAQRYPSVAALADDLRRHLAHQPVSARPATWTYRSARFVRRNRAVVAAALLVVLAVAGGLVGTVTQARRAEVQAQSAAHERDNALRQLAYAEAGNEFISTLLGEGVAKPFTTAELLLRGEAVVARQFGADPAQRARLEQMLATLFGQAKETDKAMLLMLQARKTARQAADPSLQADIECQLGQLHISAGSFDAARALLDATIARVRAADPTDRATLASCLYSRSQLNDARGDASAALVDAKLALDVLGPPRPDLRMLAVLIRSSLADAQASLGQAAAAVGEYSRVGAELQAMGRERSRLNATLLNNLGLLLSRAGQPLAALQAYQKALDIDRALGAAGPDATLQGNYAKLLVDLGRPREATPLFMQAMALAEARGNRRAAPGIALQAAPAWCATQDLTRCAELLSEARAGLTALLPAGHSRLATLEMTQAQLALAQGDVVLARAGLQNAVAVFDAAKDNNNLGIRALTLLARSDLQLGEINAAAAHAARAVTKARAALAGFEHSEWLGSALLAQGLVQQARGEGAAAKASWSSALVHLQASAGEAAPNTVEVRRLLAGS